MRFNLGEDSLTIIFEGIEQFWALKRRLVIPRNHILHGEWNADGFIRRGELGLRLAGTNVPGLLYAGSFKALAGRRFAYIRHPHYAKGGIQAKNLLTLSLQNEKYDQLLLTVDDSQMASSIIIWNS